MSRTQSIRRSLRLSIDPNAYPFKSTTHQSLSSPSSSGQLTPDSYDSSSDSEDWIVRSVLCLHDFEASETGHLSFQKNDILDIVKEEDSGWWAALRDGEVGWIPSTFVQPVSQEMADKLRALRPEIREFEYDAERLYNAAPVSHVHSLYGEPVQIDRWISAEGTEAKPYKPPTRTIGPNAPPASWRPFSTSAARIEGSSDSYFQELEVMPDSRPRSQRPMLTPPPPSPETPIPKPPSRKPSALQLNKPTPPTPTSGGFPSSPATSSKVGFGRSRSDSAANIIQQGRRRAEDVIRTPLRRLSTLIEASRASDGSPRTASSPRGASPYSATSNSSMSGKFEEGFQNAKLTQAHLPWYLRPSYTAQVIKVDFEGNVKAGTLGALIERLVAEPFTNGPDNTFRNAFLMMMKTFASADEVFGLLVEHYEMDHPSSLCDEEFEQWKEKRLRPIQQRVLTILTMWMEDHRMLETDPHLQKKLSEFLTLIVTPANLAITAKFMQASMHRILSGQAQSPMTPCVVPKRRKSKSRRNDLLRIDPAELAEQLCLIQHKVYARITPQECMNWTRTQAGREVAHLLALASAHDKLVNWIKLSVLQVEAVGKRAETLDFWIKVAEKCQALDNLFSLSALLTALSSTVLTRLHLSWAHSSKRSALEPLLKLNEPTGGFCGFRKLLANAEGPCVPFFAMFLTDLAHLNDQYSNNVPPLNEGDPTLILFTKRQRMYEVIATMLKAQNKPYPIAEDETIVKFIELNMRAGDAKDQTWFWQKSQDVSQVELQHADIRKGLEAAGF